MARQPPHLGPGQPRARNPPETGKAVRPDAIIATGRSDYPNQVNNVLCFPYIFRGALWTAAPPRSRRDEACLPCAPSPSWPRPSSTDEVAAAYEGQQLSFGPDYLIPKPFDPRLIMRIAPAVAQAAAGVRRGHPPHRRHGRLPRHLQTLRLASGSMMKRLVLCRRQEAAKQRVAYCRR